MIKELEAYDVIKHLKNYYDRNKDDEKWIIKGNILTTPAMLDYLEVKLLLDHINNLQKKAELVEHYKHLYSEVKKQKDDVVECCNKSIKSINDRLAFVDTKQTHPNEYQRIRLKAFRTKCKEILRMLGEIK